MRLEFPFGRAAFWILILAIASGIGILAMERRSPAPGRHDLTFVTFARQHYEAYAPAIAEFEKRKGIKVHIQLVDSRALGSRLQAALQVGADVPDMVEMQSGGMGTFTRGPLEDVGFVDITDRIRSEGLRERVVSSRFSLWTSRGRTFALPHDVHPMMLVYRRDIVEQLGIDVGKLDTWEEFSRVGREVAKDKDANGLPKHYMLDLPADGLMLRPLLLQQGVGLFDEHGRVTFDNEVAVRTTCWHARQTVGANRIAFSAGWGQTLAQCVNEGLVLFYFCPDWRSYAFAAEVPGLSGKMALMPMPAWEKGGRRVSTWGGTGLAFTRKCRDAGRFEIAWELANFLYYDKAQLGKRFAAMNILAPTKDAWDLPEFKEPRAFYGGQAIGTLYAELAPQTPAEYVTPYTTIAEGKLNEALSNITLKYRQDGDSGLEDFARGELKRCADRVREVMARNAFYARADGGGAP